MRNNNAAMQMVRCRRRGEVLESLAWLLHPAHTNCSTLGGVELCAKTTTCCSLSSLLEVPNTLDDPCREERPPHGNQFLVHLT